MAEWLGISLYVTIGVVLLVLEFFLPAHGLIGVVGVGVLGYAIYLMFCESQTAGVIGLVSVIVGLPVLLVVSVKYWHRTPMGRYISPPNPVLTEQDRMPVAELERLVGRVGRTLTPLRPVGTCEFDGRRIECLAEYGMIERNVRVEGVRLVDRSLSVKPTADPADQDTTA